MALEGKRTPEFPPEELDPELIKLPRKKSAISPLTSLALLVFCAYAFFKLLPNANYALQDSEATLKSAKELDVSDVGRVVTTESPLDFSNPWVVQKSQSSLGTRWVKLLGSDGQVWAVLSGDVWKDKNPIALLKGRLRNVVELPQYKSLRDGLSSLKQTRVISGEELLKSKSANAASLIDVYGDSIDVSPEQNIEIRFKDPKRMLLRASRTKEYNDEPIWRAALVKQGLLGLEDRPIETRENEWTYEVAIGKTFTEINTLLDEAKVFAARAEPMHLVSQALYKDITASGGELEIRSGEVIEASSVDAVLVSKATPLHPEAMALIVSDMPSNHKRSLFGIVFVVLAGCFLLWNFFRELKLRLN